MSTMTTKQFADAIGTDPRTLRKYLRDSTPRESHPGKGGRWELPGDKRSLSAHRKRFLTWQKEQADAQAERAAKAAKDAAEAAAMAETEEVDSATETIESDED